MDTRSEDCWGFESSNGIPDFCKFEEANSCCFWCDSIVFCFSSKTQLDKKISISHPDACISLAVLLFKLCVAIFVRCCNYLGTLARSPTRTLGGPTPRESYLGTPTPPHPGGGLASRDPRQSSTAASRRYSTGGDVETGGQTSPVGSLLSKGDTAPDRANPFQGTDTTRAPRVTRMHPLGDESDAQLFSGGWTSAGSKRTPPDEGARRVPFVGWMGVTNGMCHGEADDVSCSFAVGGHLCAASTPPTVCHSAYAYRGLLWERATEVKTRQRGKRRGHTPLRSSSGPYASFGDKTLVCSWQIARHSMGPAGKGRRWNPPGHENGARQELNFWHCLARPIAKLPHTHPPSMHPQN